LILCQSELLTGAHLDAHFDDNLMPDNSFINLMPALSDCLTTVGHIACIDSRRERSHKRRTDHRDHPSRMSSSTLAWCIWYLAGGDRRDDDADVGHSPMQSASSSQQPTARWNMTADRLTYSPL